MLDELGEGGWFLKDAGHLVLEFLRRELMAFGPECRERGFDSVHVPVELLCDDLEILGVLDLQPLPGAGCNPPFDGMISPW